MKQILYDFHVFLVDCHVLWTSYLLSDNVVYSFLFFLYT
jgi:hypothetical protein